MRQGADANQNSLPLLEGHPYITMIFYAKQAPLRAKPRHFALFEQGCQNAHN
jgi:hypothetical protein